MKRLATVMALGTGLVLLGASAAEAQLVNFPVYGTPSAYGTPSTYVAGTYGGGLNDASGKQNAIGAAIGRTGIGGRVTAYAGGGLVLYDEPLDSEITLGGGVGIDVLPEDAGAQLAVQGGIGWQQQSFTVLGQTTDFTTLNFPVGVSLGTTVESESAIVRPWVMPRLNIVRVSASGGSTTETDFGASGGVAITLPSGFGFHAALDLVAADNAVWLFGGGVHYIIN